MKPLIAAATLLFLLGGGSPSWAAVRLEAEASPSARRPIARIVFGVTLENDAMPQEGRLIVEQLGVGASRSVELPLQLAANARKHLLVALDTQPGGQDFELRFEVDSEILAATRIRVPVVSPTGRLVGVLGPIPGWLRRQSDSEMRAVELNPALLPSHANTWPTIDAILWPDPRTGDLEEPAAVALRGWVRAGGLLLVGTAADQPRALEELGFGSWPAAGESFERSGLGEAARSELDLARVEPAEGLGLRAAPSPANGMRWWLSAESLFETLTTSMVRNSRATPDVPVQPVAWILGAFLLLSGPGEWLARRHAAKRGRRPIFAALRRPVLITVTVGAVLAATGGFVDKDLEMVRIDVIDVDLESGASRARAYAALRRGSGGWMQLEVPVGTHLSAGLGSRSSQHANQWGNDGYEPTRSLRARPRPDASHRSATYLPDQWTTVTWRLAYEPDQALLETARTRARTETAGAGVRFAHPTAFDASLSLSEQEELHRIANDKAWACNRASNSRDLVDCAVASCNPLHGIHARRRGMRRPDMEWPSGAAAWISVSEEASGPELLVNGAPVPGRRFTVYRVLLSEEPS